MLVTPISQSKNHLYSGIKSCLQEYIQFSGLPKFRFTLHTLPSKLGAGLNKLAIDIYQNNNIDVRDSEVKDKAQADFTYQLKFELTLSKQKVGYLTLDIPVSDFPNNRLYDIFEDLPTKLLRILIHHRIEQLARKLFSKPISWLGNSSTLINFERELLQLASAESHVLLSGKQGSGKILAALTIHALSECDNAPFIVTNCANWDQLQLKAIFERKMTLANQGTLYLRNFHMLAKNSQNIVINRILFYRKFNDTNKEFYCRFILANRDIPEVDNILINLAKPFLIPLGMPDLTQRRADIRVLGKKILEDLRTSGGYQLDERCWQYLENYEWQGHVNQLSQVLQLLTNNCYKNNISYADFQATLPEFVSSKPVDFTFHSPMEINQIAVSIASDVPLTLAQEHPAIVRAVNYICKHYTNNIDVSELSNHACISPSHFSYLFKSRFDSTFKQFLNLCRIEKSKLLLLQQPEQQITTISTELGFWDLSHFEKNFKKLVGTTPKKYRQQQNLSDVSLISKMRQAKKTVVK